jgi:hypothetical protein
MSDEQQMLRARARLGLGANALTGDRLVGGAADAVGLLARDAANMDFEVIEIAGVRFSGLHAENPALCNGVRRRTLDLP